MEHRQMRRKDRAIPEEQARALLESGEYGVLSTVGEDGQPYGVPLNYVLLEDTIYIHCAKDGHKIDNIRACGRASFCVVGATEPVHIPGGFSTNYESVIAFGKIEGIEDKEKKAAVLQALCVKYFPSMAKEAAGYVGKSADHTAVYGLQIQYVSGKARTGKG